MVANRTAPTLMVDFHVAVILENLILIKRTVPVCIIQNVICHMCCTHFRPSKLELNCFPVIHDLYLRITASSMCLPRGWQDTVVYWQVSYIFTVCCKAGSIFIFVQNFFNLSSRCNLILQSTQHHVTIIYHKTSKGNYWHWNSLFSTPIVYATTLIVY